MRASVRCACVYIRGDVYTCVFMWGCVWERERKRRGIEKWRPSAERNLVFISLQIEIGTVPGMKMKNFESIWLSSSCSCWGVGFAAHTHLFCIPALRGYLKSGLRYPSGAHSQSDPGNAEYLTDLFMNLRLFYLKAWPAVSNSKVRSPAIKLDFASQEKRGRDNAFWKTSM